MEEVVQKLDQIFREQHALMWPILAGIAVITTWILKAVLSSLSKRVKKFSASTDSQWDDALAYVLSEVHSGFVFFWVLFLLVNTFQTSEKSQKSLQFFVVAFSVYQIGLVGLYLIRNWREAFLKKRVATDASSASVLGLLFAGIQTAFVLTIILVGLSNLGVDIGALIAGLGVGGIAVALAAQNILGDLLASLSIVLDQPFVIGDFIVVGQDKGTVERIGIKTTRLRSLSGEELIFSNKDLLENRVRNFKRMRERRVVLNFSVIYSTSPGELEKIPKFIQDIVQKYSLLRFERCHFVRYGASALEFEAVFWVTDPDNNLFMDLQQKVLIDMLRAFEREGVKLNLPTQSLKVDTLNLIGSPKH
ncbi:MAG: mechanosensitive ion channel family protein [Bdellovibrionales bacterium]|nr:mechanosensitive ion channel family protein [Bdellovibrionales bacterium]